MLRKRSFSSHPSDKSGDHEVKPENMEADQTTHESVLHVKSAILHVLTQVVVALLLKTPDYMSREEP